MKQVIIDFSNCRYSMDLHNEIRTKLELPDWYGNNLNALWDALTGIIETPIDITVIFKPGIKGAENLKESVLKIIEVFKEAAADDEEIIFSYEF